ncbi:MAG: hypothetical protein IJV14_14445 [Lachnospiraceae bacterium]|nr:hypothetical protein [Lachnospiraceae bacterium]
MRKKWYGWMAAVIAAAMLAGCAGQSGSPETGSEAGAAAVEQAAEQETAETAESEEAAGSAESGQEADAAQAADGQDAAAGEAEGTEAAEEAEAPAEATESAEAEKTAANTDEASEEGAGESDTIIVSAESVSKDTEAEKQTASEETVAVSEEKEDGLEQSAESAAAGERKRRELPHQEIVEQEKIDSVTAFEDTTKRPESISGPSIMFIENKKTTEPRLKWKDDSFPDSEEDVQQILADLMRYWDSYNMDAVDYLVRMEKYRYLSQLLAGTNEYFYCGETNEKGDPHGKGIAVYAGNQYYFGHFKDGLRSGDGTWYQVFERGGDYCKANYGIYLHSYAGQWENDLPNGSGQEHISLDQEYLTKRICTNVIGTFKDGYYDGEEIVTSLDENNNFINWKGTAIKGAWAPVSATMIRNAEGQTEFAALQSYDNPNDYFWMLQKENSGQGITGLVPVN